MILTQTTAILDVETVGARAFAYCDSLTTFVADRLQTVGDEAFAYCLSLTNPPQRRPI